MRVNLKNQAKQLIIDDLFQLVQHFNQFQKLTQKSKPIKYRTRKLNKYNKLTRDIAQIKQNQTYTINQLNRLNQLIIDKTGVEAVPDFNFDKTQDLKSDKIYDYFSFKIKPDSIMNLNSPSEYYFAKGKRSLSPNKLKNNYFLEDTRSFQTIKPTIKDLNPVTNPFNQTNKTLRSNGNRSDSELNNNKVNNFKTYKRILESTRVKENLYLNNIKTDINNQNLEVKIDENNNKADKNINLIDRINDDFSFIKTDLDINISDINYTNSNDKLDNTDKINKLESAHDHIKNNLDTTSNYNDSVSINTSQTNSITNRAKQVRGFNFKNNINTKKFNKPLFSKKSSENKLNTITDPENLEKHLNNNNLDESKENFAVISPLTSTNVIKSANFDDRIKIKRLNFNNNINIKKFTRQESNTANNISNINNINTNSNQKEFEFEAKQTEVLEELNNDE